MVTGEDEDYDGNEFEYPEGIDSDSEILAHKAELDSIDALMKNHAGYSNFEKRDDEFEKLRDKWYKLRNVNVKLQVYLKQLGVGQMLEVAQKGGSDQGSEWYSVKHFVDHDVYIKFNYYYSSYEGIDIEENEYSDCKNVEPVEKMIIVYNEKK